jgi:hypothetical protein
MNLQTGDILHCRGKRLLSRLIAFATNSEFTHTAIVKVEEGEVFIAEMQKNGCELKSYENWQKDYGYKYVATRCHNVSNLNISGKIYNKIGFARYDIALLFLRYPVKLLKSLIFNKEFSINRKKNEEMRMTCSEFVAYCYGWSEPQNYSPKDVYDKCIKEGHIIL